MKKEMIVSIAALIAPHLCAMDSEQPAAASAPRMSVSSHEATFHRMQQELSQGAPVAIFLQGTERLHEQVHELVALHAEKAVLVVALKRHIMTEKSFVWEKEFVDMDEIRRQLDVLIDIAHTGATTVDVAQVCSLTKFRETVSLGITACKAQIQAMKKILDISEQARPRQKRSKYMHADAKP